jgi:GAF domain-containing protein
MRDLRSRTSIATNIMWLVLAVVAISVAIIAGASLVGVFNLARDEAQASEDAVRRTAEAAIAARLEESSRTLDRAARIVVDPAAESVDRGRLAREYELAAENVDTLLIAEPDGEVLVSIPSFRALASVAGIQGFSGDLDETPRFSYDPEQKTLWVMRSAQGPQGELVLLTRVRLGFLDTIVDEFASESEARWVAITAADGSTVASSVIGPEVSLDTVRLEASDEEADAGTIAALDATGEAMVGQYAAIAGYPGLDWRVMVAEPRSHVMETTTRALGPAVVALVVTALIALGFAAMFSQRLVMPINDLERRVRQAVSGAYVRPLETERTDEIGELSEAFNAVALRLNALHDLSQLLASSPSVDQVLDGIMSAMGHIVGPSSIAVLLVDQESRTLELVRTRGVPGSPELTLSLDEQSWAIDTLSGEGPVSFKGAPRPMLDAFQLEASESVTGLAAPLTVGSEALGIVVVIDVEHRGFSQAEMEMVRTFSAQAAVAVYNSRLFEHESQSRREAEVLRRVAERLARHGQMSEALTDISKMIEPLFDVACAEYAIIDRPSLAMPPAEDPASERLLLRAWGRAMIAYPGEQITTIGRGEDKVVDAVLESREAREVTLATVPRGDAAGAVIALYLEVEDVHFSARTRHLAEALSKQVALALENAYYFAEAQRRAGDLETIFRISQAVGSSLDIKVVLNRVLDVVQKIFGADAVSLMTYDPQRRMIKTAMARGLISSEMLHFECSPGEDVPGRVFESGRPAKIDELDTTVGKYAEEAAGQGLHSALCVPLLARAHSVGVLTVFSDETAMYTQEDMGLLRTFASQAALAIDTADLYGREHGVASVLQDSLLPERLPEFPEVATSAVYKPAGDEAEIGGDYYDVFRAADGRLVAAIGDVCGKGTVAATKTSMIKYTIRGLAAAGLDPASILGEVNRMVAESGAPSDIVTLLVVRFDIEEGRLLYANGGHPPAVLYTAATKQVERLEPTGPLLGAVPSAEYDLGVAKVAPCDLLLMYTDGVTEARKGTKFFGEGRVQRAVKYGGSPEATIERLVASLLRFAPGALRDDAAMLAVQIKEDAGFVPREKESAS